MDAYSGGLGCSDSPREGKPSSYVCDLIQGQGSKPQYVLAMVKHFSYKQCELLFVLQRLHSNNKAIIVIFQVASTLQ